MTIPVATLGFPRIGPRRELKVALERHWAGELDEAGLQDVARALRAATWARQAALGATVLPSGDFSFYDQVLDATAMLGALAPRHAAAGPPGSLAAYFAAARGVAGDASGGGVTASEMTKWFDTNYHHLVAELTAGQTFTRTSTKAVDEFREAAALGLDTRPVLVGPVTWLLLAKSTDDSDPLDLLDAVVEVYGEVLGELAAAGARWVQLDEPGLVTDLSPVARAAYERAYTALADAAPGLDVMVATYFGALGDNLDLACALPVAGLHVDLVRGAGQLEAVLAARRDDQVLSLGVVDGRNVWRHDLRTTLDRLGPVVDRVGAERVQLAPSCSLLHVPVDRDLEPALDPVVAGSLSFAVQKVAELATLAAGLERGAAAVEDELAEAEAARAARAAAPGTVRADVRARTAGVGGAMARRPQPYADRRRAQQEVRPLPLLPTTTIGSFPQTAEVRRVRAGLAHGRVDQAAHDRFMEDAIAEAVAWQEQIGLDVLVHGEFERNDMVQYFAEQLDGFVSTTMAWVQSYGSRCVRPPIITGDVARPAPMTVRWSAFAQSRSQRPVKGMLTGPVTMLQWSFVRDDLPRAEVAAQVALALRDEVVELQDAGIGIVQIDEPALREGLPLRAADRPAYLDWAVRSFRVAASGVAATTQIHTHMCYSEFNDIIEAIAALDADVISIETARSNLELLEAFTTASWPAEIGPGVYDIHAPRTPGVEELVALLRRAVDVLDPAQVWVNPDCGLKTRTWEQVRPALVNMVAAAARVRAELAGR